MVLKVSLNTGINRIRLEFKGSICYDSTSRGIVLIESDWNLKTFVWNKVTNQNEVLIESDWNLKIVCAVGMGWYIKVLIESDWNLKPLETGMI